MNFRDFGLSENTIRALDDLHFEEATDIQAQSIPVIIDHKDMIGFSQTGSGKTAAYGLPILQTIDLKLNAALPQVLILCPTRELAMQVTDEMRKFSKYTERLHIVPVYGGAPINKQVADVRSGCQIVVGTPGRIMDLMGRHVLKFGSLKTVILDEADEMLNMGFREDIEHILDCTPEDRQTLLFSATMPAAIIDITGKYQKDPVMVKIESKQLTAINIEQLYFEVARGRKKDALALLLQYYAPTLSLVFCNTKKMVDELTEDLKIRGFSVNSLHGDMRQIQRTKVMHSFKNGAFEILVATDIAARGIDVNNIDIVFNFDLPDDNEYYIHRIGRTARGGKSGKSFTLIQNGGELTALSKIAGYTHSTITKTPLPTVAQINNRVCAEFAEKIKTFIAENDNSESEEQLQMLRAAGLSDTQIAAALVKMALNEKLLKKGTRDIPQADIKAEPFSRGNRRAPKARVRTQNKKAIEKFKDVQMGQISISIGRNDKVAPKHILGAIAGESGLPGSIMGTIDIHGSYTTVSVPKQFKTKIIKSLDQRTIKGKKVTVK